MHSRRTLSRWLLFVVAAVLVVTDSHPAVGQLTGFGGGGADASAPAPIRKQLLARDYVPNDPMPASEREVRMRLRKTISSNYQETPLEDVLVDLAARLELQILIDKTAFTDVGIATEEPITLNVAEISGAATLANVLEPFGLDWVEHDGVLIVGPPEAFAAEMLSRVYDVSDLVLTADAEGNVVADFEDLIVAIEQGIYASWEWHEGVPGNIQRFETETMNTIVVRNEFWVFPVLNRILNDIRSIQASDAVVPRPPLPARVLELEERLARRVSVDFDETPLSDAINEVGRLIDVPILINKQALAEVGLSLDEPISLRVKDVLAATAFDLMLKPRGLTSIIHHEVVQVTTSEVADKMTEGRVYDVRDLVRYQSRSGASEIDPASLIEMLQESTGGFWGDFHSNGDCVCLTKSGPPVLIVRHTPQIHREIERIITELRALQTPREQPAATSTIEQN